uniref:BMP and activin membrane-bound inhibitor C-terminal domain-containing protein n=3 Tax=Lutzomyia longipalpis TaxID=7200 RepID=A0A1B0CJA3_LUTLO
MCKTAATGGCFSEFKETENDDDLPARRGCMELLEDNKHTKCNLEIGMHHQFKSSFTLLMCCQEDMCNHIDNPDNRRFKSDPRINGEGNQSRGSQSMEDIHHSLHETDTKELRPVYPASGDNQDEVWFKVATIAITICGAIILFVLIATAIRMLRNDGRGGDTASKLGTGSSPNCAGRKVILDFGDAYNQVYGGSSHGSNIKHVPLLKVDDGLPPSYTIYPPPNYHQLQNLQHTPKVSSDSKNEAQAKKNQIKSLEYTLLPQSCHEGQQKPINTEMGINPAYRDVNLSSLPQGRACPEMAIDNKMYEKDMLTSVPTNWTNNSTTNNSYGV